MIDKENRTEEEKLSCRNALEPDSPNGGVSEERSREEGFLEKEPLKKDDSVANAPPVPDDAAAKGMSRAKRWIWTLIAIALAGLTVFAVVQSQKDFSFRDFGKYIQNASAPWMTAAVVCMLGFILFEGIAIRKVCKNFSYPCSVKNGFLYSASDIYFSAITPSATGGQPVCAFFMVRDGIPMLIVTLALLINLLMYTLSIILIGIICILLRPGLFFSFGTPSRILIIVGCVMQLGLALFFFLLVKQEKILHKLCRFGVRFLGKIRLVKNVDAKLEKLQRSMSEYRRYTAMAFEHKGMLSFVFLFNFLQRASQIAVTMMVFLGTGGNPAHAFDIYAVQSYVVLGSNCMPVPGAMGISDYLMLDGFSSILSGEAAVNLELLSRTVSFYSCIVICGIAVMIKYISIAKRRRSI